MSGPSERYGRITLPEGRSFGYIGSIGCLRVDSLNPTDLLTDPIVPGGVVSLPTLAHNIVRLMGFDAKAQPVIRMDLHTGRLTPAVERWMANFIATPPELAGDAWSPPTDAQQAPRDSVMVYPSIAMGWLFLVAFDENGAPQLAIEVPADRLSAELERWMLEFIRTDVSTPLDRPLSR